MTRMLCALAAAALIGGCGSAASGAGGGGGSNGSGGGSAGGSGGSGGGAAAGGGSGGSGGGSGGSGGGDAGTAMKICNQLGDNCTCPDAGANCTSAMFSDVPYLLCLHDKCTSYCNAPTQAERQAKCPTLTCTSYAFGNESPTWQCR